MIGGDIQSLTKREYKGAGVLINPATIGAQADEKHGTVNMER